MKKNIKILVIDEETEKYLDVLEDDKLSKIMELQGPPLKISKHVSLFKKKHKKTFIKGKKLFALEKRKFNDVRDLVKNLFKTTNVKGNVSNITLI